jgi:hypothetical protein
MERRHKLWKLRSAERAPADAVCLTDLRPLPADSRNSAKSGTALRFHALIPSCQEKVCVLHLETYAEALGAVRAERTADGS